MGSTGPHSHGLIDVAVGDQSSGVSRSGAIYGKRDSVSMSLAEIDEIKSRREAERIQAEKDARAARFAEALAAVASGDLSINQASCSTMSIGPP